MKQVILEFYDWMLVRLTSDIPVEWGVLLPNVASESHATISVVVAAGGSAIIMLGTLTAENFAEFFLANFVPRASSLEIM
jgi:hypothetical protein